MKSCLNCGYGKNFKNGLGWCKSIRQWCQSSLLIDEDEVDLDKYPGYVEVKYDCPFWCREALHIEIYARYSDYIEADMTLLRYTHPAYHHYLQDGYDNS